MKKKLFTFLLALILATAALPMNALAALPEGVPSMLEAPVIKGIELKHDEDGIPYFEAQVYFPQSVLDLDADAPGGGSVFWDYSEKIDDGEWSDFGGGGYIDVYTGVSSEVEGRVTAGTYPIEFTPIDEGSADSVDIKDHTYSYRLVFFYHYFEGWQDIDPIYSPVSNAYTIASGSFYSDASSWAEEELDEAGRLGLIPDILNGADMTKPITREEFAELAVLLYEKVMDTEAAPEYPNPFVDTANPQILKAFALGITTGTSVTTFEPNKLINREQCATMLFRTIKAISGDTDDLNYQVSNVPDFPDQKHISSWAVVGTKYMSQLGIIKGDTNGYFMPKAVTTQQEAEGYGTATREAAILMTVRTYNKIA
ncbi:MAG: S-layer homology domain-containing protein [Clostridiales bacterium]|nr:S-layer homology domain-containing protein [Clostridiales bacterium]